jgi:hypothetical protein
MLQLGCPLLPAYALRVLCLVLAGLAGIWGLAIYPSAEDLDDIYDGNRMRVDPPKMGTSP